MNAMPNNTSARERFKAIVAQIEEDMRSKSPDVPLYNVSGIINTRLADLSFEYHLDPRLTFRFMGDLKGSGGLEWASGYASTFGEAMEMLKKAASGRVFENPNFEKYCAEGRTWYELRRIAGVSAPYHSKGHWSFELKRGLSLHAVPLLTSCPGIEVTEFSSNRDGCYIALRTDMNIQPLLSFASKRWAADKDPRLPVLEGLYASS